MTWTAASSQCLEYAVWARLTNLDEVAGLYYVGIPQHLRRMLVKQPPLSPGEVTHRS